MRNRAGAFLTAAALTAGIASSTELAGRPQDQVAVATATAGGLSFAVAIPYQRVVLAVSGPTGLVFDREFARGSNPAFTLGSEEGVALRDGRYNYALRILQATGADRISEQGEDPPRKAERMVVRKGSFSVRGGAIFMDDDVAAERRGQEEVAR